MGPFRLNTEGALVVSNYAGKYKEAVLQGRCYVVANQAAVALTAAMATTWTGLVVSNPVGSGINVVILRFGYANTVLVPTATVIGLMTGVTPTAAIDAALTPRNCMVGGVAGLARADNTHDLTGGVPVLDRVFSTAGTVALTSSPNGVPQDIDLDGSIILPPGAYCATYSFAANTAAWIFSFMWEEVPV
jgi:hypothetical protein